MECRDCHLWSHAGSRPLTWAAKEFKSGSERRRCQRRGNQNRVREEESERKRWWVNADSGETTREIKQATSAIGSLSHPFSSRSWLLFLQKKTLWPSLPSLPLFLPSSFLPMSHLPGFHSPNQNYSGCHCLLDSLPLVWSPLPQQIDQRRAGPPTDCLIWGNNKNRKKKQKPFAIVPRCMMTSCN